MIIEITNEPGSVQAMGHRVSLEAGGEPELKRRCFESLSRLNAPPDEVLFQRLGEVRRVEAVDIPASVASLPEPTPVPELGPPDTVPDTVPAIAAFTPVTPPARSHKKRA